MRGPVLVLVRLLPFLFSHGLAAPRTDSRSGQSGNLNISNPFTPGEGHLSILHGYLQEKDPLGGNDSHMTRETAILRLFVLHDYDKSGLLDGLELMLLLQGVLTKGLQEKPSEDSVISVVDDVLEKQDVNLDGLLSAQELVDSLSYKEGAMADSAHVVIPPPMGVRAEGPPAPADIDPPNKEEPELHNQTAEDPHTLPEEAHHPAPPPVETSQEEPDEILHEEVVADVVSEDVVEDVVSEVEAVEMPGEDDKLDDEM